MKEKFQQIFAQVRDLYLSMTPGNRLLSGLLVAVLIVSLGYLIIGSINMGNPQSKLLRLYDGRTFSQDEQMAIENALAAEGLRDYEWVAGSVQVPRDKKARYTSVIALASAIKPKGNARNEAVANFTTWSSGKIIEEQSIQARAQDLADAIQAMPEIARAEVMPTPRTEWNKQDFVNKKVFSVTILVDAVMAKPLALNTISAIGHAAAGAFGITDRDQMRKEIRIVDRKHSRAYNGFAEHSDGAHNDYLTQQTRYQEEYEGAIYALLPPIDGLKVKASVTLDKLINQKNYAVTYGDAAALHEHVRGYDYEHQGLDRFGRVGDIAQNGTPLLEGENNRATGAYTKEKKHEQETNNILPGEEQRYEVIPFTPTAVRATILFPDEYVKMLWRAKNPPPAPVEGEVAAPHEPTPEEFEAEKALLVEQTKTSVAKLFEPYLDSRARGASALDLIEVSTYHMSVEPEEILTAWQQLTLWLGQNWQSLSLMGLVLCGLCVLWTISKPAKPEPIVIYEAPDVPMDLIEARAKAVAEAEAAAVAEDEDEDHERTLEGFDRSIRSLQEEIAELVEENPEAAASVLRQWIGNIVPVDVK